VNVNLPQYAPSRRTCEYDVAQVSVIKGGPSGRFNRSGGFTLFGQQVRKNKLSGSGAFPLQIMEMTRGRGRRDHVPNDQTWLVAWAVRSSQIASSFTVRISPRDDTQQRGQNVTVTSEVSEHAKRGIRQADLHPTSSMVDNGSYRDSNRTEKGTTFDSFSAPTTVSGSDRLKVVPRGFMDPKSVRGRDTI